MIVTALTKPWRNLGEPAVEVIGGSVRCSPHEGTHAPRQPGSNHQALPRGDGSAGHPPPGPPSGRSAWFLVGANPWVISPLQEKLINQRCCDQRAPSHTS